MNDFVPSGANVAAPRIEDPWLPLSVRIERIVPEVLGVATYELAFVDSDAAARYRFVPGQFNMLYLPGAGEMPISLSANPESRDTWAHTIRIVGNVTRTLAELEVGHTFGLRGPFGSGWPLEQCAGRDVILVGGGIGLAPLRPAIYALLNDRSQFGRLVLLVGARSPDTLLYAAEYDDWTDAGLIVQTTVDRSAPGWLGNVGVVTLMLERLLAFDASRTVIFACGPEVMMRFTVTTALERGVSPERIWLSMERNMQCAFGVCGHCQLGPDFICKDGPVLRSDRLAPYLSVEGL